MSHKYRQHYSQSELHTDCWPTLITFLLWHSELQQSHVNNYLIQAVFANGGLARARYGKMITAIQIDNDQRLHIDYLTRSRTDTLIVDKKNFTFNLVKCGGVATDAIWCRVNNEEFWIPKSNLQINNQQHHHLLWSLKKYYWTSLFFIFLP